MFWGFGLLLTQNYTFDCVIWVLHIFFHCSPKVNQLIQKIISRVIIGNRNKCCSSSNPRHWFMCLQMSKIRENLLIYMISESSVTFFIFECYWMFFFCCVAVTCGLNEMLQTISSQTQQHGYLMLRWNMNEFMVKNV